MKLKKIASLMLAGIMAVSMLAGCNGAPIDDDSNGGDQGNTASGYSAMMGDKLAADLEDEDLDDIVTFADSATDQAALEDALGNLGFVDIGRYSDVAEPIGVGNPVRDDFKDAAGVEIHRLLTPVTGDFFDDWTNVGNTRKIGAVFAVDGTVKLDKAIGMLVEDYKAAFTSLESGVTVTDSSTPGKTTDYDFAYTVSVSVVNVPVTSVTIYNNSVNFIALTITRTASVA